MPTATIFS